MDLLEEYQVVVELKAGMENQTLNRQISGKWKDDGGRNQTTVSSATVNEGMSFSGLLMFASLHSRKENLIGLAKECAHFLA